VNSARDLLRRFWDRSRSLVAEPALSAVEGLLGMTKKMPEAWKELIGDC
jgi:hypothetical protein